VTVTQDRRVRVTIGGRRCPRPGLRQHDQSEAKQIALRLLAGGASNPRAGRARSNFPSHFQWSAAARPRHLTSLAPGAVGYRVPHKLIQ
jgi:hypothetical protein